MNSVGSNTGRREGSRRGRRAGVPSLVDWLAPAIWGVWALAGNGLNGLGRPGQSTAVKPGVRDAIKPRNQPHCGATLDNDRGTH